MRSYGSDSSNLYSARKHTVALLQLGNTLLDSSKTLINIFLEQSTIIGEINISSFFSEKDEVEDAFVG